MNIQKSLRMILQIIALGIFSFQMVMAVRKYFSKTTITTTEQKDIQDSQLPTVTFCTMDQFDINKSKMLGYKALHNFVIGDLADTSDLSWEGKNNLAYDDMKKELFNAENITKVQVKGYDVSIIVEDAFILPYGYCRKIELKSLAKKMYVKFWNFDRLYQAFMTNPIETTNISISKWSIVGDAIVNDGFHWRKFYMVNLIEVELVFHI